MALHAQTSSASLAPDIQLDSLVAPISAQYPAGQALDTEVLVLEQRATAKPSINEGPTEPPKWLEIREAASELLKRTKNLRVAAVQARALAHTDGWSGFSLGLTAIQLLLEHHWDSLYPPLDHEDPYPRVNALVSMASEEFIAELRAAPLMASLSLRDLESNEGKAKALPLYTALTPEQRLTVSCSLHTLQDIARIMASHQAAIDSDIEPLFALVRRADALMQALASQLAPQASAADATTAKASAPGTDGEFSMTPVRKRADVLYALDQICAYYDLNEPSSPVPLLLRRAKRLVSMRFMDVIKDLADRGVEQIQLIIGHGENT